MKKGKGLKRTVVGLLATVMAATPLAGCKNTPKDDRTITMDVAASVTVEVGSEYRVPTAFAFDGSNDYAATITVKNGDETVSLTDNKFIVRLMSDYTITYYADCGNGKDITKTTTLKVKDETDPVIAFGTIKKGKTGERYVPDFAVSDNSGSADVEMKVKYEDGSDVTVTDNGFTPDKVGNYTVSVTATDQKGNAATETITVTVGETFITPISSDLETELITYLSGEANVVEGVAGETEGIREGTKAVKIDVSSADQWPSYAIDPELSAALVKLYDGISFDVYVSGAQYLHKIGTGAEWVEDAVVIRSGEWTTVTITKAAIENYNGTTDQSRMIGNGKPEENGLGNEDFTLYFDNVRGVMQNETVILGSTLDLSEKFAAIIDEFDGATITGFGVTDGSGNSVTAGVDSAAYTFTPATDGDYTVSATLTKENYRDITFAIAVSVEKGNMMPASLDLETQVVEYISGSGSTVIEGTAGETTGIRAGSKAVKADVITGDEWPTYKLDPTIAKKLVTIYDAVLLDVYTDGAANIHKFSTGTAWDSDLVTVQPATWTTLTFTKAAIENYNVTPTFADQNRVIYNGNELKENFTLYFDNLRGVIYTEGVEVGDTKDFTEKLNAIKTTLGAEGVTLAIEKDGAAVTEGVSGLTFIPNAIGKYTAVATFTKTNYNDYKVTIDFEVKKADMHPAGEVKDGECVEDVFGQLVEDDGEGGTKIQAAVSVNYDPAFVREGSKSIKYYVGSQWYGYCTYVLGNDTAYVQNLIAKYDAISFDVYNDGAKDHKFATGGASWTDKCVTLKSKSWTTVTITKADVIANTKGERLLDNSDSSNENSFSIYIDNLRGVNYYDDDMMFGETLDLTDRVNALKTSLGADGATLTVLDASDNSVNGIVSGFTATPTAEGNYTAVVTFTKANYNDYVVKYDFAVAKLDMFPANAHPDAETEENVFGLYSGHTAKATMSVNTDKRFVREGSKSVKFAVNEYQDYFNFTFNIGFGSTGNNVATIAELLENNDAIAFDVYVDGNGTYQIATGNGWNVGYVDVPAKQWTTITITKENIEGFARGDEDCRDVQNKDAHAVDFYFDNLRGVKFYNDDITLGGSVDFTDRVNALKTSLGAESVNFAVTNNLGTTVTEGINGYAITPTETGTYTVTATFTKQNYNDYVVTYRFTVTSDTYVKDGEIEAFLEGADTVVTDNTDLNFVRSGDKSKKFYVSSTDYANPAYKLNKESEYVKTLLANYNAIAFDFYIDGNYSHKIGTGGASWEDKLVEVQPKTWTTITITKADIEALDSGRIVYNGWGVSTTEIFSFYIDNLRGVNV